MKQIDIVVIGQNYSTSLGLIQAAGEAGYGVGVVHSTVHPVKHQPLETKSKYVRDYIIIENRAEENRLLSLIIDRFSSNGQKVVLLPSDDYSAALLDRNLSELEKYFYLPNSSNTAGEIIRCMDKGRQAKMAIEAGLPKAKCWEIVLDGGSEVAIPDGIVYPCITKPLRSISTPKTYIRRCNNGSELRELLTLINLERPCPVLIEEFINVDTEYTVPILSMGGSVVIPAVLEKFSTGSGGHKGVTIAGKVVSSLHFTDVVNKLKILIKKAELQGIFDIELFKSGDNFFFNELNLRYGAAGYALTRAGVNIPALWIEYCNNKQLLSEDFHLSDGLSFVSDKAAIESLDSGYLRLRDYRRLVSSVDFRFLVDNSDTPVNQGFRRIERRTIFYRMIKSLFA